MKKDQGKVWLARKLGAKENASVHWNTQGKLIIGWADGGNWGSFGNVSPKLARLLAKRIIEALED